MESSARDAYSRLIHPSLENELRAELPAKAAEGANTVFGENLRQLLLQPPIRGKTVMGLDPGYRMGCKVAVVDPTGKALDTNVVYPVPEFKRVDQAKKTIKSKVLKNEVEVMAIGIFLTTSYILRATVGVSCILAVEKFSDAPIFAFASAVTTTSPNCSELGYKVAFRTYVLPNSNLISVKTAFL